MAVMRGPSAAPRQFRWFYPGLKVKRWITLIMAGVLLFSFGATLIVGKNIPLQIYASIKDLTGKPGAIGITLAIPNMRGQPSPRTL